MQAEPARSGKAGIDPPCVRAVVTVDGRYGQGAPSPGNSMGISGTQPPLPLFGAQVCTLDAQDAFAEEMTSAP